MLLISAILYLVAIIDCTHVGQPQGLGNSCTEHSNNQTADALVEDQLQSPLNKSETSTNQTSERAWVFCFACNTGHVVFTPDYKTACEIECFLVCIGFCH